MKLWLIQTVVSPYRVPLFARIAQAPGVEFTLMLLSDRFKARPEWKRDLNTFPFKVRVPFGWSFRTNPEHELCVNPLLLPLLLWERPDVVVCGGYSFATLMVWVASRVSRIRYLIWTEATLHTDGKISGLRLALRRLLARHAAAFIDAGTLARGYVMHLDPGIPKERLFRAYNCVDNDAFTRLGQGEAEYARKRGFPSNYLLFVGKLNERKGTPALLEVYRRVAGKQPQTGLVLIGEGPLMAQAEQFKAKHQLSGLFLEGWVTNEDTAKYYRTARAFILLSSLDHNPLVLFEALAAGLPIICSKGACNAPDFIQDGVNGFIVDPSNLEEVEARLLEVVGWDEARRRLCSEFSRKAVQRANYVDAADAFVQASRTAVHLAGIAKPGGNLAETRNESPKSCP